MFLASRAVGNPLDVVQENDSTLMRLLQKSKLALDSRFVIFWHISRSSLPPCPSHLMDRAGREALLPGGASASASASASRPAVRRGALAAVLLVSCVLSAWWNLHDDFDDTGVVRPLLPGPTAARGGGKVWRVGPVLLRPSPRGGAGFDSVAVKDPSLLYAKGAWHVLYTARGPLGYAIGHVSAPTLEGLGGGQRTKLELPSSIPLLPGKSRYPCAAPQVFFFRPHGLFYLVFQTSESNYMPAYSTSPDIAVPSLWAPPRHLAEEHRRADTAKWIDFWVLCSGPSCYLFFTRAHMEVCAMEAPISAFPSGFGPPRRVFGPVFEAVHVYAARGAPPGESFHLMYELRGVREIKVSRKGGAGRKGGGAGVGRSRTGKAEADRRRYGLATAPHPLGPWTVREEPWAAEQHLWWGEDSSSAGAWTEEVSHGELVRVDRDERLEVDARAPTRLLAQGLLHVEHAGDYRELPWRLGLLERAARYEG